MDENEDVKDASDEVMAQLEPLLANILSRSDVAAVFDRSPIIFASENAKVGVGAVPEDESGLLETDPTTEPLKIPLSELSDSEQAWVETSVRELMQKQLSLILAPTNQIRDEFSDYFYSVVHHFNSDGYHCRHAANYFDPMAFFEQPEIFEYSNKTLIYVNGAKANADELECLASPELCEKIQTVLKAKSIYLWILVTKEAFTDAQDCVPGRSGAGVIEPIGENIAVTLTDVQANLDVGLNDQAVMFLASFFFRLPFAEFHALLDLLLPVSADAEAAATSDRDEQIARCGLTLGLVAPDLYGYEFSSRQLMQGYKNALLATKPHGLKKYFAPLVGAFFSTEDYSDAFTRGFIDTVIDLRDRQIIEFGAKQLMDAFERVRLKQTGSFRGIDRYQQLVSRLTDSPSGTREVLQHKDELLAVCQEQSKNWNENLRSDTQLQQTCSQVFAKRISMSQVIAAAEEDKRFDLLHDLLDRVHALNSLASSAFRANKLYWEITHDLLETRHVPPLPDLRGKHKWILTRPMQAVTVDRLSRTLTRDQSLLSRAVRRWPELLHNEEGKDYRAAYFGLAILSASKRPLKRCARGVIDLDTLTFLSKPAAGEDLAQIGYYLVENQVVEGSQKKLSREITFDWYLLLAQALGQGITNRNELRCSVKSLIGPFVSKISAAHREMLFLKVIAAADQVATELQPALSGGPVRALQTVADVVQNPERQHDDR